MFLSSSCFRRKQEELFFTKKMTNFLYNVSNQRLKKAITKEFVMQNCKEKDHSPKHKNKLGYIDPTVAGIDIGSELIHVSVSNGSGGVIITEFGTTTPELKSIVELLKTQRATTGVMEATGVYWVPLYELLEDAGLTAVLVDAKSVKNVPGRKTDVQDCQWIQTLYSNGLLRAAFRPPRDRIKLRSFVRQRQIIIKTKQVALLHMEKALQLMNIKLSFAVSDIASVSGMNIIRAIVKGERDPAKLASLRNIHCKKPIETFIAALSGNFQEEHLFALKQALDHHDFALSQLKECDTRIKAELESYPDIATTPLPKRDKDKKKNGKYASARKPQKNALSFNAQEMLWKKSGIDLTALTGFEVNTALLVFSELGGADVSAWSNAKEFASWLKLCPGNNISGGKRRKSKKQPCANYISQALRMASLAAKKSHTYMGAHIRRICGRTDKSKGIKAGAHKIAHQLYYMCKNGWLFHEKGQDYYEKTQKEKIMKNLIRTARENGFKLVPIAQAA
jgi:transposase